MSLISTIRFEGRPRASAVARLTASGSLISLFVASASQSLQRAMGLGPYFSMILLLIFIRSFFDFYQRVSIL